MQERGQISIEFLIVLILLSSLLLFSLAVFSERNTGFIHARENFEARLLADKMAREINAVYLAGNGTETRLLFEQRVDFNVSVLGNAVVLEWRNGYVDAPVLTDDITIISLSQGTWINVRNVSGGIEIENA